MAIITLTLQKSRLVDITVKLIAHHETSLDDLPWFQVLAVHDNGHIYLDQKFLPESFSRAVAEYYKNA